jgi:hypothetical protein
MLLLTILTTLLMGSPNRADASCDVAEIYSAVAAPFGTLALTSLGEMDEIELVLVPAKIDDGTYSVAVSRMASNLYKVDGKNTYVKTRYCYEYAYSQDAVLRIDGPGSSRGTLIFE